MPKKIAWHTDIVVRGKGFGLAVLQKENGGLVLEAKPDMPGNASRDAFRKFREALRETPKATTVTEAKAKVEHAVKKTRARWNRWHREAY